MSATEIAAEAEFLFELENGASLETGWIAITEEARRALLTSKRWGTVVALLADRINAAHPPADAQKLGSSGA